MTDQQRTGHLQYRRLEVELQRAAQAITSKFRVRPFLDVRFSPILSNHLLSIAFFVKYLINRHPIIEHADNAITRRDLSCITLFCSPSRIHIRPTKRSTTGNGHFGCIDLVDICRVCRLWRELSRWTLQRWGRRRTSTCAAAIHQTKPSTTQPASSTCALSAPNVSPDPLTCTIRT